MNETIKTIAQRYSCRAYDGKLPEKSKLEAIALAAVQSPSGMNRQPWFFVCSADVPGKIDVFTAAPGEGKPVPDRIDMGIALCHLWAAGERFKMGFACSDTIPAEPPEGFVYIGTVG